MQNIAYFMFFMLTKHFFYSFSYLTPYNCVFCRNEENETKSKQFEQEMRKICNEEVVVTTTSLWSQPHSKNMNKPV